MQQRRCECIPKNLIVIRVFRCRKNNFVRQDRLTNLKAKKRLDNEIGQPIHF